MAATNIDNVSTYFEFPFLTKVHTEPTYEYIQEIKNKIKANTTTVVSEIGRVKNGHLVILLTPQEYTHAHATAYVCIQEPATLNVSQGTSQHAESIMSSDYVDERRQLKKLPTSRKHL